MTDHESVRYQADPMDMTRTPDSLAMASRHEQNRPLEIRPASNIVIERTSTNAQHRLSISSQPGGDASSGGTKRERSPPADHNDDDGENTMDTENAEKGAGAGKGGKSKKKKGQKFYCSGFGNCSLAFTRSEHLARHIRKHTGERPFMCHCGRWFSRLDNLRQHSSTVHADEEIPPHSLASHGSKYNRQSRQSRSNRSSTPRGKAVDGQNDERNAASQEATPAADRLKRRRPEPLILQDGQAFLQYRSQTPPDSPPSAADPYMSIPSSSLRQRPLSYPQAASRGSSPITTPTSSTYSSVFNSPFHSPAYSHRSSLTFDSPIQSVAARRMSMPIPPTPSSFAFSDSFGSNTANLPPASPGSPHSRGSLTPGSDLQRSAADLRLDDRRKTWHLGASSDFADAMHTHQDLSGPVEAGPLIHQAQEREHFVPDASPVLQSAQTSRLPSIQDVLAGSGGGAGGGSGGGQRVSWAPMSETPSFNMPAFPRPSTASRRIAPGQTRSSHGRSISNIETRRWGVVLPSPGTNNPFSGPAANGYGEMRELGARDPAAPDTMPLPHGDHYTERMPRRDRQSSDESCASDALATPDMGSLESVMPVIVDDTSGLPHAADGGYTAGEMKAYANVGLSPMTQQFATTQMSETNGIGSFVDFGADAAAAVAVSEPGRSGISSELSGLDALVSAAELATRMEC